MPVIADYSIIRDSSFTIKTGGDIDRSFNFSLPSSLYRDNRSILAFVMDGASNLNNLRLEVLINGTSLRHPVLNQDSLQTLHEVVGSNVLRVGSNTCEFRITSGSGTMNLSDVVLWWQRSV